MKKLFSILFLFTITLSLFAQNNEKRRFNPVQFAKDQEAFIMSKAQLTQQEATAFFPVFREMQNKQRELFKKTREYMRMKPQSDKEAAEIICKIDDLESQIKRIQAQYHNKFCKIIPATKVYNCIKAEEIFKHHAMENAARQAPPRKR